MPRPGLLLGITVPGDQGLRCDRAAVGTRLRRLPQCAAFHASSRTTPFHESPTALSAAHADDSSGEPPLPSRGAVHNSPERRFVRTERTTHVTSGAFGCIPLMRQSRNGRRTDCSRLVQYGLNSRYSTRFRPATISRSHSRLIVVVSLSISVLLFARSSEGRRLHFPRRPLASGTTATRISSSVTSLAIMAARTSKPHNPDGRTLSLRAAQRVTAW